MIRINKISKYLILGTFVAACTLGGCTKKPSEEELAKLEEARSAAESAERKLAELRQERMGLESELAQKQGELSKHEEERDELKEKMGK